MRDALVILKLPGGYYGRSVTRVGYLRRIGGDEWELLPGARTLYRTGGDLTPLDRLASHGPTMNHRLTDPQVGVEWVSRTLIRRLFPCNLEVWTKHIERPADWRDE